MANTQIRAKIRKKYHPKLCTYIIINNYKIIN